MDFELTPEKKQEIIDTAVNAAHEWADFENDKSIDGDAIWDTEYHDWIPSREFAISMIDRIQDSIYSDEDYYFNADEMSERDQEEVINAIIKQIKSDYPEYFEGDDEFNRDMDDESTYDDFDDDDEMNEIKRMNKLAGLLNEDEETSSSNGLITFEELKRSVIKEYSEYSGQDIDELQEWEMAEDINSLINLLDETGFNGDEAYEFIFDSILK